MVELISEGVFLNESDVTARFYGLCSIIFIKTLINGTHAQ